MKIGSNLKEYRTLNGMTQEQAAEQIGLTRQAVSGYETGKRQPDLEMLEKFAVLYGTDMEGILYGRNKELQEQRAFRKTSAVIGAGALVLLLIAFGLLGFAHTVLAIPSTGQPLEGAMREIAERHFKVLEYHAGVSSLSILWTQAGCLILAIKMTAMKNLPGAKDVVRETAGFLCAGILLAIPFILADSVFRTDYLLVLLHMWIPVCLLFLYYMAFRGFRNLKKRNRT